MRVSQQKQVSEEVRAMRKTDEHKQSHRDTMCFQQRLLEHVEMVYNVALQLGGNSRNAECLTRSTMSRIWRRRDTLPETVELKPELLTQLRQTFLDKQWIDLRIKTRWEYDSHTADRPLKAKTNNSRKNGEEEDSVLAAAF